MSNLRYTDKELLEMEKYASLAADREPYHLTYARAYKLGIEKAIEIVKEGGTE
ncbi:MAG: hypothetical protein NC548_44730 [Lachnospiraceae bacterium]|nr:hypothetical protein [Lachnospiraceae bacterium]